MKKYLNSISIAILLLAILATATNAQSLQEKLNVKPDVTVQFNILVDNVNEAYETAENEEELREYLRYLLPTLQDMVESIVHYNQHFPIARYVNGTIEKDAWSTLTIIWLMGELAFEVGDYSLAIYSFIMLEGLHEEYPDLDIHEGVDADYLEFMSLHAISSFLNEIPGGEN